MIRSLGQCLSCVALASAFILTMAGCADGLSRPPAADETAPAAKEAEHKLAMPLTPGMTYSCTVNVHVDMQIPMGIPNADTQRSTIVLDSEVLSTDQQGQTLVEVTLSSLNVSMDSLGVKAKYDSAETEPPTNLDSKQQRFRKVFEGLAGLKYKALLDAQMNVIKLQDVAGPLQAAVSGKSEGSLGRDQLALLISEDNLKEAVVPAYLGAMESPQVEPEASWRGQRHVLAPRSATLLAQRKHVLTAYEQDDSGATIAKLKFNSWLKEDMANEQNAAVKSSGLEIVKAGDQGEAEFNVSESFPVKTTEKQRVQIRTAGAAGRRTSPQQEKNKIYYLFKREYLYQK